MPTRKIPALVLLALFALPSLRTAACAQDADYVLGPQDKLRIKVNDWRTAAGEAHEWTALTGEFTISASGNVSLPLLGEVPAENLTTAALGADLAQRLQAKIGLAQRPDASVEVAEYRPFYVTGVVAKPGEYPFRPGITLLQAVAIAGGLVRPPDESLTVFERDAVTSRGELRALATERDELLARQARLDAQVSEARTITFPAELLQRRSDPDIARMLREESLLFDTAASTLQSQIALAEQSKSLLSKEVEQLGAKGQSLQEQLTLAKQELQQVSDLVDRGLAVTPRKLAVQQNAAQFQSSQLDVQLATLRAQQDIAKADRDIVDLKDKQRSAVLTEASDVRSKLRSVVERIATTERLIYQAEVRAPELAATANAVRRRPPVFKLTRRLAEGVATSTVDEGDALQPGDTVRVEEPADDGMLAIDETTSGTRGFAPSRDRALEGSHEASSAP